MNVHTQAHTNNHVTSGINIGLGNRHLKYVIFKQTIYWNVHIDDTILSTVTEKDKISWGPTVQFLGSITGIKGLFFYTGCSQSVHIFNIRLF